MRDLANNLSVIRAIAPITVGTTGTGRTGVAIDLRGFDSALFTLNYGAITSTAAVFTVVVQESDAATGGFTSVADADLIGTEANAGVAAATRTSGTTQNVTKEIGYSGVKRYVRCIMRSTATAGTPISANVLRGHASRAPV